MLFNCVRREAKLFTNFFFCETLIDKVHYPFFGRRELGVKLWAANNAFVLTFSSQWAFNFFKVKPAEIINIVGGCIKLSKVAFTESSDYQELIIRNIHCTLLILLR